MKKKYYVYQINMVTLNVLSLLLLLFMAGLTFIVNPEIITNMFSSYDLKHTFLILILMFLYFILHEILHAVGYVLYGANFKKITFGIEAEKGVFYCLCKEEISRKNILNSCMFPLIYIGIVTYIIGLIFQFPTLVLLSIANISGAAGDIMYFMFISKLDKSIKFTELDDAVSFAIISEKDPNEYNHFGLKFIGNHDSISRNDFKKIKISKGSWWVLLFLIIVSICLLFL